MSRFTSMFHDADGSGDWSMTRVVAMLFAVVVCYGVVRMAAQDHLHDVGWPFAALGVVTLVAVPVQALFRLVEQYLRSRPGAAMLSKLIERGTDLLSGPPDVSTTVNVNPTTGDSEDG